MGRTRHQNWAPNSERRQLKGSRNWSHFLPGSSQNRSMGAPNRRPTPIGCSAEANFVPNSGSRAPGALAASSASTRWVGLVLPCAAFWCLLVPFGALCYLVLSCGSRPLGLVASAHSALLGGPFGLRTALRVTPRTSGSCSVHCACGARRPQSAVCSDKCAQDGPCTSCPLASQQRHTKHSGV